MSSNELVAKQIVAHPYHGMVLSKKEIKWKNYWCIQLLGRFSKELCHVFKTTISEGHTLYDFYISFKVIKLWKWKIDCHMRPQSLCEKCEEWVAVTSMLWSLWGLFVVGTTWFYTWRWNWIALHIHTRVDVKPVKSE